jgi:DNA polymerase-3 subunit delta
MNGESGWLKMLYLFYGEDRLSLREEVGRIKAETIPAEAEDFNFVRLDAERANFQMEQVINNADAFPFMNDKRMVVVSGVSTKLGKSADTAPARGRGGKAKGETKSMSPREKLLDFLGRVPQSTVLVLIESKVAKNEVLYKAAAQYGEVREFEPPTGLQLENWVVNRAKKNKIKLENAAAAQLANYIGPDLYRLDNELQKLASYAGDGQAITIQMVDHMTAEAHNTSVFKLTDALGRRNIAEAIKILNQLRQETNLNKQGFTRQLFAIMSKQIYDLVRIRQLADNRKRAEDIAAILKLNPYAVKLNLEMVRNFSSERLDYLYHRLTELDYADKTGRGDLTIQLDLLVAEICQR